LGCEQGSGVDERSNFSGELEKIDRGLEIETKADELLAKQNLFKNIFEQSDDVLIDDLQDWANDLNLQLTYFLNAYRSSLGISVIRELEDTFDKITLLLEVLNEQEAGGVDILPGELSYGIRAILIDGGDADIDFDSIFVFTEDIQALQLVESNFRDLFRESGVNTKLTDLEEWRVFAIAEIDLFLLENLDKCEPSLLEDLQNGRAQLVEQEELFDNLINLLRRTILPVDIAEGITALCVSDSERLDWEGIFTVVGDSGFSNIDFDEIKEMIDEDGNIDIMGITYPIAQVEYESFSAFLGMDEHEDDLNDILLFNTNSALEDLQEIDESKPPKKWLLALAFKNKLKKTNKKLMKDLSDTYREKIIGGYGFYFDELQVLLESQMAQDLEIVTTGLELKWCLGLRILGDDDEADNRDCPF